MPIIFGTHRQTLNQDGRGHRVLWWSHPPTPATVQPEIRALLTRQEQPRHPYPYLSIGGVPGPNVAPGPQVRNTIFLRQETPFHPGSLFRSSIHFSRIPNRDWIILRQETPRHTGSILSFAKPDNVTRAFSELNQLFVRQETPDHRLWPKPIVRNGFPTESAHTFGRVMGGE